MPKVGRWSGDILEDGDELDDDDVLDAAKRYLEGTVGPLNDLRVIDMDKMGAERDEARALAARLWDELGEERRERNRLQLRLEALQPRSDGSVMTLTPTSSTSGGVPHLAALRASSGAPPPDHTRKPPPQNPRRNRKRRRR